MKSVIVVSKTRLYRHTIDNSLTGRGQFVWNREDDLSFSNAEENIFFAMNINSGVLNDLEEDDAFLIRNVVTNPMLSTIDFRNEDSLHIALCLFPDGSFVMDDHGNWYMLPV